MAKVSESFETLSERPTKFEVGHYDPKMLPRRGTNPDTMSNRMPRKRQPTVVGSRRHEANESQPC
jgi:hypothetical protein